MSKTKVYEVWKTMLQRCRNPSSVAWAFYGGRGIKVCDRWLRFENFHADMGDPPPGMWLDRKNNNGDYEPGNCEWTTREVQSRNRRNNHLITYGRKTLPLVAWAAETGLTREAIGARLRRGWTTGQALGFAKPPAGAGRRPWRAKAGH